MWSVIRKGFRRHALMVAFAGAALVAGLGVIAPESAQAATLYISEFASPVGQVGSVQANVYPQPAITDQTVAITGASVQSAAFNASTHAIQVECDSDCSVSIGTNPTATTTNYLMGDGVPYQFVVVPGQKIAVISNTSGGSGSDVNLTAVAGIPVVAGTAPVPVGFYNPSGGALLDPTLPAQVVGSVPAGATDSGNPVKTGGVYNATLPTLVDGQRGNTQLTLGGAALTSIFSTFSTPADALSNSNVTGTIPALTGGTIPSIRVLPMLFNGTSWDRPRSGGVTGMAGVTPQATPSGGGSFTHIAVGQATTTVKSGAGTLYSITFNSAAVATDVTTIYDSTTGSGTVIAIPAVTGLTSQSTLNFGPVGLAFATGLTIVTATANGSDMTVVWK